MCTRNYNYHLKPLSLNPTPIHTFKKDSLEAADNHMISLGHKIEEYALTITHLNRKPVLSNKLSKV